MAVVEDGMVWLLEKIFMGLWMAGNRLQSAITCPRGRHEFLGDGEHSPCKRCAMTRGGHYGK